MYINNNELTHHGVMGMKWGVRRYQNADGSLTPRGKKQFEKVANNPRLQKRQQKEAIRGFKRKSRMYNAERNAAYYNKKAEKARIKGDVKKVAKYVDLGKRYTEIDTQLKTRLSDLSSEKLKAGRDFILQHDYDVNLLTITKTTTMVKK